MNRALLAALLLAACKRSEPVPREQPLPVETPADARLEVTLPPSIATPPPLPLPPPPAPPAGPPVLEKLDADAAVAAVRAHASKADPRFTISRISARYVEASGLADPEHGSISVDLGVTTTPIDDPNRKTGAPVKPPQDRPTRCDGWIASASGWSQRPSSCTEIRHVTKCTVKDIWQRAMAKGAPADALATVELQMTGTPRWSFRIRDELRSVNVAQYFADDCEHTLEAPPPK